MSNPHNYTVGCICALSTESVALQAFLDERHHPPVEVSQHDNNAYALGKIGSHNVVIAVLPHGSYGLVNATSVAKDMLHTFPNVRIGLMVGIGGGAPSPRHDVRLGDVVVSCPENGETGVLQFDFGKKIQDQEFLETGSLNKPPKVLLTAIAQLRTRYETDGHQLEEEIAKVLQEKVRLRKNYSRPPSDSDRLYKSAFTHPVSGAADCSETCGDDSLILESRHSRDQEAGDDNLIVHYGLVASSNMLMKDARVRDKLAIDRGVLCFEMEAAGLMDDFPCIVIRGICDYADTHKNKAWQGYAAMAASAYAKDLLRQISPNKIESERRINEVLRGMMSNLDIIHHTSHEIKDNLHAIRQDNFSRGIKMWLSPSDPSINANSARKARCIGTGTWFLESRHFTEWKDGVRQHLWLHGNAGCGKTVLSTTILDHIAQVGNFTTLFFFFDFSDAAKQKLDDLLRSLVFQLYTLRHETSAPLNDLFGIYGSKERQPDTDALSQCLKEMLQVSSCKVVILQDALDECSQRSELLRWMKDFVPTLPNVQFILTSRYENEFQRSLSGWVEERNCRRLDKTSVNGDIHSYINNRLDGLELERWARSPDFIREVVETISRQADGMFLWAVHQLDSLAQCRCRDEVEEVLRSLPRTLNATYMRIIETIPERRRKKAIRLLQFLAYSKRPLNGAEAIDVISVCYDERPSEVGHFDPDNRPQRHEDIRDYCSSLVSVSTLSSGKLRLQLAHFSVKEYIMSPSMQSFHNLEITITEVCLIYIESIKVNYELDCLWTLRSRYPLIKLAAFSWMQAAKYAEVSKHTLETVVGFLRNKPSLLLWLSHLGAPLIGGRDFRLLEKSLGILNPNHPGHNELAISKVSPLYLACLFNLPATVENLVLAGEDIDATGGGYDPVLFLASKKGKEAMVKLLLDLGANVNAKGRNSHSSALHVASSNGSEAIVRLLLDHGADANAVGRVDGSLLQVAAENRHDGIVRLLLLHGARTNIGGGGRSLLYRASGDGNIPLVRLLLDHGADVDIQGDKDGIHYGTALWNASRHGRLDIVNLLLDHGADVNATTDCKTDPFNPPGYKCGTALQIAAEKGEEGIVRLLLDRGADVDADCGCGTALQRASYAGYAAIVQLLLEKGANKDMCGGRYGSALQAASRRDHVQVVRHLVDYGANIDIYTDRFGTALQAASRRGHISIVRFLLDSSANVNAGGMATTPLLEASSSGHEDIVKLLLEKGASTDVCGEDDRFALQLASWRGDLSIVRLLLDHGANVNVGGRASTPLQQASMMGHTAIVQLLLDHDADANAGHPLCVASDRGHEAIVRLLLDHNANINACDDSTCGYGTPLRAALNNDHQATVKLLIDRGVDIYAGGGLFLSALAIASNYG